MSLCCSSMVVAGPRRGRAYQSFARPSRAGAARAGHPVGDYRPLPLPASRPRAIAEQSLFRHGGASSQMEHCAFASEGPDGIEFCSSERRSAGGGGTARAPCRNGLQRRRRELSRGARRALRRARDPPRDLPPGRRRGIHGRGLRQIDRQARGAARDPRPGRLQRLDRHPHGVPGFDPDGRAGRPGRPPTDRPRGLSGGRFPPHVRPARQMGGADRPRRTRSRTA